MMMIYPDKWYLVLIRQFPCQTAGHVARMLVTGYGLDENLVVYRRAGKSLSSNKLEAVRRIWNLYRKVEGLSVIKSCYYFVFWGYNAVARRV